MTRTPKQVGAYSRRKGSAFEREVALMFSNWTGLICRRTPMSGAYGPDWGLAGDLMFMSDEPPNFIIELKRREGWTWEGILNGRGPIFKWWEKLNDECKLDPRKPEPILGFKKNRGEIWLGFRWLLSCPFVFDEPPAVTVRLPNVPITLCRAKDVSGWRVQE